MSGGGVRLVAVGIALLAAPRSARASCNVIPELTGRFVSAGGEASTPFAQPGDVVTLRRTSAFAADPARNRVFLDFRHADGSITTVPDVEVIAPSEGTDCAPSRDCVGETCSCLAFRFPDTDDANAPPGDGRPLTGPVDVRAETDGVPVARVDVLIDPVTGAPRMDLTHFLALPPRNDFSRLVGVPADPASPCGVTAPNPGPALGTMDDAGNLFVPLDMRGVRPTGKPPFDVLVQAPVVEAHVPGATLGDPADLQLYSPDGHRLPPLVRRAGDAALVGVADGPFSVLRVDHAAVPAGVSRTGGAGPVVIPGVEGFADPCKRVDTTSAQFGDRMLVYQNDECNPLSDAGYCMDLNGDGDEDDHFLRAFDMTVPNAESTIIDQIDESEDLDVHPAVLPPDSQCQSFLAAFGLPLGVPAYGLYRFVASDDLVAFVVAETSCFDLDGDGIVGSPPVRAGAYDLGRRARVWPAEGSDRVELSGDVLAFTATGGPTGRGLFVYDAAAPDPVVPRLVPEPSFGDLAPSEYPSFPWGYLAYGRDAFDVRSLAVHGRRVGFVVGTRFGIGGPAYVYDVDGQTLVDLDPGGATRYTGRLALSDRWLAAETDDRGVLVYDLDGGAPARSICTGGFAPFAPSISDAIVPCVAGNRLHAYLPLVAGGPADVDLGLSVYDGADTLVDGDELVAGVSEQLAGMDLDGNGVVGGSPFGAFVVHTFDATTETVTNLGVDVLYPRAPMLQRLEGVLVVVSPRAVLRTGRVGFTFFPRPPPPTPPDNDECRTATPIAATPFHAEVDTSTALTPVHDPVVRCMPADACNGGRGHGSVWYAFTAPATGTVTVDAGASAFPAVLDVERGTCATRTAIGCSATGRVVFEVAGGFTYFIEVAGAGCDDAGRAVVDVGFVPRSTTTLPAVSTTTDTTTSTTTSSTTSSTSASRSSTTTTTLAPECRADADCTAAPRCAVAACQAGRCAYAVVGFDGVGCALAAALPPPPCAASPALAASMARVTSRAGRLVSAAASEPRPRHRRALLGRAARTLTAFTARVARLTRRTRLTPECEHETVRLVAGLAHAIEELRR